MVCYTKTICPGFDEIEVMGNSDSDWLYITQKIGRDVGVQRVVIRSNEAVRDLHYALSRYVAVMEEEERRMEAVRNRR